MTLKKISSTGLLAAAAIAVLSCGASRAASETPLSKGVYAVLGEGATREEVKPGKTPQRVLLYQGKYVALDTSSFVPLVLAGPPVAARDERGWTSLGVTLAREHVKTLEEFTRAHLHGRIAIVIDGEIVTLHKVQSVISDGKAQITRCGDDACETLRVKLTR